MRGLHRNKIRIFFANYLSRHQITDDYGNLTGDYRIEYSNPVEIWASVSAARGEVTTQQFGEDVRYNRVVLIDDLKCSISETSVLWIDTLPEIKADGSTDTPPDYIVKQVATSLNSKSIAVSRVNVSG